jgi:hypothetical protein
MVACGLLLAAGIAGGAQASSEGSFYPAQAKRAAVQAHRAAIRAASADREARHVLAATRQLSAMYSTTVGRWVQCARRAGWEWSEFGVLFAIIDRESGGGNEAVSSAGAVGLTQQMPGWSDGSYFGWHYDRSDGYQNLLHARMAKRRPEVGWSPWTPVPAARWSPSW